MAICKECGKKFGFLQGADGKCAECNLQSVRNKAIVDTPLPVVEREQVITETDAVEVANALDSILLTTETALDLTILRRIEIVSAECALGMNIFKDLFASVRDIVGGRSNAVESTMREARRTALLELKKEAYRAGANAVIGVSLNYVELGGSGSTMVMLVATGTAVEVSLPQLA